MSNNDYILRSDINDARRKWLETDYDYRSFTEVIEDIPAADVEPVRHGKWIPINRINPSWSQFGIAQHKCSECGSEEVIARKRCPECGAKMNEEANNAEHI